MTLVDMFSYIAVHVHVDKAKASKKVYSEIRGCIHNGISIACTVLGYEGFHFEDALICPCSHGIHVAK